MQAQRASASKRPRAVAGSDGFAAVDALVALTILAATIALSLEAATNAAHAAAAADEVRRADTLLQYLLQSRQTGEAGHSDRFTWSVDVTPLAAPQAGHALELCRHAAEAREPRSGRRYTLATLAICPAKAAS